MDEGFAAYAVRGEGLCIELEELVIAHFVVTCDDNSSVVAAKSVRYGEGLRSDVAFF